MTDHPARFTVAAELAKLKLEDICKYMDTPTIEDGTRRRLAHGLLARADRIIEMVEAGAKASRDKWENTP